MWCAVCKSGSENCRGGICPQSPAHGPMTSTVNPFKRKEIERPEKDVGGNFEKIRRQRPSRPQE